MGELQAVWNEPSQVDLTLETQKSAPHPPNEGKGAGRSSKSRGQNRHHHDGAQSQTAADQSQPAPASPTANHRPAEYPHNQLDTLAGTRGSVLSRRYRESSNG